MATDILLVDDDPFIRKLVATTLRGVGGFRLHEAEDGLVALALASGLDLALCFLDVDMPRLGGIETCRRLRGGPARHAVIVMLTATEDPAVEALARAAGADRFLTKPFSPLTLLRMVDALPAAA